jgi:hypothetical protein
MQRGCVGSVRRILFCFFILSRIGITASWLGRARFRKIVGYTFESVNISARDGKKVAVHDTKCIHNYLNSKVYQMQSRMEAGNW